MGSENIDFDTYCGVDILLLPFAGVLETIEFLKQQHTTEAKKALDYVMRCFQCGDFNDQSHYFSPNAYLGFYEYRFTIISKVWKVCLKPGIIF